MIKRGVFKCFLTNFLFILFDWFVFFRVFFRKRSKDIPQKYVKAVYREYTDSTYTVPKPRPAWTGRAALLIFSIFSIKQILYLVCVIFHMFINGLYSAINEINKTNKNISQNLTVKFSRFTVMKMIWRLMLWTIIVFLFDFLTHRTKCNSFRACIFRFCLKLGGHIFDFFKKVLSSGCRYSRSGDCCSSWWLGGGPL